MPAVGQDTPPRCGQGLRTLGQLDGLHTEGEAQRPAQVPTPATSMAELLSGIRTLPAGKRKNMLNRALTELLELFKDRVLPFDTDAARHYADLAVTAENGRRGFPTPAGYIAAVAASRGFIVASCDTSPYEAASVTVINPWKDAQGQRHPTRAENRTTEVRASGSRATPIR